MLSVTEEALQHMSILLTSGDTPEGTVVRCVVDGGNVTLMPGLEEPGDTVFRFEDKAVLVVAGEIADVLEGREFAVQDTAEGPQLTLRESGAE